MKKLSTFILILVLGHGVIESQIFELPLKQQVNNSALIIEGEVIGQRSFETINKNYIYTAYKVRLAKIFKGEISDKIIEIVRPGGQVGPRAMEVTPSLKLRIGQFATFFLEPASDQNFPKSKEPLPYYKAFASQQSVFKYEESSGKVSGLFKRFDNIEQSWYAEIQNIAKEPFRKVDELDFPLSLASRSAGPIVNNITPTTITAGTHTELTITGSNFGPGTCAGFGCWVEFKNSHDGGATSFRATGDDYQFWSETEIRVRVPSDAGTGYVEVHKLGMGSDSSAQILNVRYAQITQRVLNQQSKRSRFVGNFDSTALVFQYETDFANNIPAVESFERAMDTWRCETNVNWLRGPNTTVDEVAADNISVVRFENEGELPDGVGGQAAVWLSFICGEALVFQVDMTFALDTSWQFGPDTAASFQIDFETVALHELGHAHLLQHVIDPAKVMHYLLNRGESKRLPSLDEFEGGQDVSNRSQFVICNYNPMSQYRPTITAICKNQNVVLNSSGAKTASPASSDNGSSSSCGSSLNFLLSQSAFTCADLGPNLVTLTVSDANNPLSSSTCSTTITVIDSQSPFVQSVSNKQHPYNEDCEYIMPNFLDSLTIIDNCNSLGFTNDQFPPPGTVFEGDQLQSVQVFIFINDAAGNSSDEVSFFVTLFNNAEPIALCKDAVVYLDNGGFADVQFNDIDNGSVWGCGTPDIFIDPSFFECFLLGTNTVNLNISLGLNDDNCSSNVTIVDTFPPDLNCPSTAFVVLPFGTEAFDENNLNLFNIVDNCFNYNLSFSPPTFACGDLPPIVTVTGTDNNSNSSQCVINIHYDDFLPPTAQCKIIADNVTINLDAFGIANITPDDIDDGSSDDCDLVSRVVSPNQYNCSHVGTLVFPTLTVTDGGGNTSDCVAQITIGDSDFPNGLSTIFVDAAASGTEDGLSWTNAFPTLNEALNKAASSCRDISSIYIAEGTYYPTDGADQTISHVVNDDISIFGGFSPSNGVIAPGDRDWTLYPTILSGDIDGDGSLDADNAQSTMEIYGDALIDGLIFEHGYSDVNVSAPGGRGGGMFLEFSDATIRNCIFRNNWSRIGGAVYLRQGNPTFINCLFYGNTALQESGALSASTGSNASMINCTITKNIAPANRNAIRIAFTPTMSLTNCLFWNNTGGDLSCYSGGSGTITNCMFQDVTQSSCIIDGGGNQLNTDPVFANPAMDDFTLGNCSPAIAGGKGDTSGLNLPVVDLAGNDRIQFGSVDIGAYENGTSGSKTVTSLSNQGAGSLRDVVAGACENDTILFDASFFDQTIQLIGPEIIIDKALTFVGLGLNHFFISGDNNSRIFHITSDGNIELQEMDLIEGHPSDGLILNQGALEVKNVGVRNIIPE